MAFEKCLFYRIIHVQCTCTILHLIQITYNAEGVYGTPLVIHKGTISESVQEEYKPKLDFIETPDGHIHYNCIGRCMEYIRE